MKERHREHQPGRGRRLDTTVAALAIAALLTGATGARAACPGDCGRDGSVTVDELIRGINVALGNDPVEVCPDVDGSADGNVTVDETVTAVNAALNGCPRQSLAFAIATDFQTGSFATVGLDAPRPVEPTRPDRLVNGDAVARTDGKRVYVVNRFGADNVQALAPDSGFATVWQCSTGNGSNPHDIAFAARGTAYVTAYDRTELLVVNLNPRQPDCSDFRIGVVDLAAYADADGIPEMDQMALVDGRLYVSLQLLDRSTYSPAGNGRIVVIDTLDNTVVDTVTLSGQNPLGAAQTAEGLTVRNGALVVAQTGAFGVLDGGIERVDLETLEPEGFFVTEEALGGDLGDFVLVSDELGYAIVGRPDFKHDLVSFNPSTGAVGDRILSAVQYLTEIELNDRGEMYVADQTLGRGGIRVLRAADGVGLTAEPLALGLPPFEIVFLPQP